MGAFEVSLFKKKSEKISEKWIKLGIQYNDAGKLEPGKLPWAIACFDQALSINPGHEEVKKLRQTTMEHLIKVGQTTIEPLLKMPDKELAKKEIMATLLDLFKECEGFIGEIPRETKTLSEKGVKTVLDFLKKYPGHLIFGSFSVNMKVMPELRRIPRDIEFRLNVDEEEAKRIAQDLMKILRDIGEKVRINPGEPAVIESFKEGKWQRAVGIHHMGEPVDISGLPVTRFVNTPTEAAIDSYALIKTLIESAKKAKYFSRATGGYTVKVIDGYRIMDENQIQFAWEPSIINGEKLLERWKSLWSDEIDFEKMMPKHKKSKKS